MVPAGPKARGNPSGKKVVHNHDETTDVDAFTTPEDEFVFDGWGRMGERKYTYVE